MENGPVEIVDLPCKHGDIPYSYVSLPESICYGIWHIMAHPSPIP